MLPKTLTSKLGSYAGSATKAMPRALTSKLGSYAGSATAKAMLPRVLRVLRRQGDGESKTVGADH